MDVSRHKQMLFSEYPLQSTDKVRYADTDRQGHVNNSVFNQFFETGRVELLYHPEHPFFSLGCSFVIVSSKVDYHKEIKWPGIVNIGTAVIRIGSSSIHLVQSLYQDNTVVATSETVIVHVDTTSTKSHSLSAENKERLLPYYLTE
jgi:acyl-CoA thioester hydrolase